MTLLVLGGTSEKHSRQTMLWALGLSKTKATKLENMEFVYKGDKMTKETNVIVYDRNKKTRQDTFNVDNRIQNWLNPDQMIGSIKWEKLLWEPQIRKTGNEGTYLNRWIIKLPYMIPPAALDLDGKHYK